MSTHNIYSENFYINFLKNKLEDISLVPRLSDQYRSLLGEESLVSFYKQLIDLSTLDTIWPLLIHEAVDMDKVPQLSMILNVIYKKFSSDERRIILDTYFKKFENQGYRDRTKKLESFLCKNIDYFISKSKGIKFFLSEINSLTQLDKKIIFLLTKKGIDTLNDISELNLSDLTENFLYVYLTNFAVTKENKSRVLQIFVNSSAQQSIDYLSDKMKTLCQSGVLEKIYPNISKDFKNSIVFPPYLIYEEDFFNKKDYAANFGITNKSLKREFFKFLCKDIEGVKVYNFLPGMIIGQFIRCMKNIDQQLLVPIISMLYKLTSDARQFNECNEIYYSEIMNKLIYILEKAGVDPLKYIKNMSKEDYLAIADAAYALDKIREMQFFDKLNREPSLFIKDMVKDKKLNTIEKVHDFFNKVVIDKNKVPLNQGLDYLEDFEVLDYKIKIPQTPEDLIKAGHNLQICVGNGRYAQLVRQKQSKIIFLTKDQSIHYCVEFCDGQLVQAKKTRNGLPTEKLQKALKDITPFIYNEEKFKEKKAAMKASLFSNLMKRFYSIL